MEIFNPTQEQMFLCSKSLMAIVAFKFPAGEIRGSEFPSSSRNFFARGRKSGIEWICMAAATSGGDVESSSRSTSSLISADNVQKAIRGIAIADVDHYARLGIARGTSYDEVQNAYARKCEELMSQGSEEGIISEKIDQLKESYVILSSEEERRLYDWSLKRAENPDRYVWPFETDITQIPTQPAPPQETEDVGPTRLVGYFFLAWIIMSFALSVTLNH